MFSVGGTDHLTVQGAPPHTTTVMFSTEHTGPDISGHERTLRKFSRNLVIRDFSYRDSVIAVLGRLAVGPPRPSSSTRTPAPGGTDRAEAAT